MYMSGYWIPRAQGPFVVWSQNYDSGLTDVAADLNLSTTEVTAFHTGQAAFMTSYTESLEVEQTPMVKAQRKELVENRRIFVRDWHNQRVRYNPGLTDAIRIRLGVPVPKKPGHSEDPTTRPEAEILYSLRQLTIRFRDEGATKWAKPAGVHGVEICWAILDTPPATVAELVHSVFDTKSPYVFTFEENQRGKHFYFVLRWENGTVGKGPWSQIYDAIIP
jgi:hypothetical protein